MAEENKAFVAFKRGTSDKLPEKGQKKAVNGTFYLTTDTNRLYVGNSDNELAEINRYIVTVQTFNELPTIGLAKGDFAYIVDENILAVCVKPDGTGLEGDPIWVQVNPDDNDNTVFTITEFSSTNVHKDDVSGDLIIPITLKAKNTENDTGATGIEYDHSINLTIPKTVFDSVTINGVSISLNASSDTDNKVLLKTQGAGAAGPGLNISGSGSVSVAYTPGAESDAGSLEIKGIDNDTKYNLTAENNQIKLNTVDGDGSADIVTIAAGTNIDITTDSANKITFSHDTITTTFPETAEKKEFSYEPITVLKSIAIENGHITEYTPIELTLDDERVSSIALGADPGTIAIGSKTSDGTEKFVTSDKILYYTYGKKDENGKAPYDAYNTEHLNVYSINEIDELMTGLNAMVYQKALEGQANFDEIVDSGKVSKGYVYYVSVDDTTGIKYYEDLNNPENNKYAKKGDLLIANGNNEDENGYLTSITWEHVPSGDEVDTQYNLLLNESSKTITLAGTDETTNTIQFLEVEGADITVDVKPLADDNTKNGTITIKHNEYTPLSIPANAPTTASPAFGGNFTVIDNIATTKNGHVTGVNVKTVTLPNAITYTFSSDTNTDEKPVLRLHNDQTSANQDIILNSDDNTIVIAADNTNRSINISHNDDYGVTEPSTENKSISGKQFAAITSITEDKGHITDYVVSTFTLPTETTYSLNHVIEDTLNKLTFSLQDNSGTNKGSVIVLDTDSLSLKSTVSDGIVTAKFDLEWGSF